METWTSTVPAEVIAFMKDGCNNVVSMQPFGCIANHIVARGIEKKLKKEYPQLNMARDIITELGAKGAELTAEKAKEVIEKHIKGGTPVTEYTIGATQL